MYIAIYYLYYFYYYRQEEESHDFGYDDEDIYEALGEDPVPEEPAPLPPRSGHLVPPPQGKRMLSL